MKRKAIALLITVFFVMLITLSIGIGLKYVNDASQTMKGELFLFQSSSLLEDILDVLKKSPELEKVASAEELYVFLESSPVIPFQSNGISVLIEIQSARSKINPNSLITEKRQEAFEDFLLKKMVDVEYAMMLFDLMGEVKPDGGYNTDIFNEKPYLFRDYVTSSEHLGELEEIYEKRYRKSHLKYINTQELFYAAKDINGSAYAIDVNYVTPLAWEFLLGCDEERALSLSEIGKVYTKKEELLLSSEEEKLLANFTYSFYEPYLDITVTIKHKERSSKIRFEYDIKSKKGANFVFEV